MKINWNNLVNAFKKRGKLFHLVEDESACNFNSGLLEALSI